MNQLYSWDEVGSLMKILRLLLQKSWPNGKTFHSHASKLAIIHATALTSTSWRKQRTRELLL